MHSGKWKQYVESVGLWPRHDDVIKWKKFPRYWSFVPGIHRSPVNSPHKGHWHGALFSLICAWIDGWVKNRSAGDLRRHRAYHDVIVMGLGIGTSCLQVPSCILTTKSSTTGLRYNTFESTCVMRASLNNTYTDKTNVSIPSKPWLS